MGSFSIWHWVVVFIWVAINIVPIIAADPRKTLPRSTFAFRTVAFFLAMIVIGVIVRYLGGFWPVIGLVAGWVFEVFLVLWSVHRVQDVGWSRWLCSVFLLPPAGLIFWLVLLFKPGRESGGEAVASAAT